MTFDPVRRFFPGERIDTTVTTDCLSATTVTTYTGFVWQFRASVGGGQALFMPHPISPLLGSGTNVDVALGDLDGDGDLDIFAANGGAYYSYTVSNTVWLNGGTGIFTLAQTLSALPSDSKAVALGDLDGDGDLDAFVANGNHSGSSFTPNRVWFNLGNGVFTDSGQTLGSSSSYDVALGDLDGDGDLDAFVSNGSGEAANVVWENDGSGFFSPLQTLVSPASDSKGVALGDLDGDGDLDAFVANGGSPLSTANRVWKNNGAGYFVNASQPFPNDPSRDVELGDLDGDGDLDAFVVNWGANRVWLNDGAANFTSNGQYLGDLSSRRVSLGDLDGDGDLDAVVTNGDYVYPIDPVTNTIWINNGAGLFARLGQLHQTSGEGSALGDIDGDGDLDILVANQNAIEVWLNANFLYLPLVLRNP